MPYLVFPAMLWSAIRFGIPGALTSVLALAAVSIAGTAAGQGMFSNLPPSQALFQVQLFLAVLAVTIFALAAALEEVRLTNTRLRESLGYRDEFVSIASHELKTPLTALTLQLGLLHRLHPAAPVGAGDIIGACERQARRLADLVDELLDLTQIRAGRLQLRRAPMDLRDVARDAVSRFREVAARAGSKLSLDVPESRIEGVLDYGRVERAIANLLSNAVKYGEGKPIHARVEGDPIEARVIVEDQGRGISEDAQKKLFRRFERGTETQGPVGGLGLGLFIVREIAEAHGGRVEVWSRERVGSHFTLRLPRAKPLRDSP
jgi:signal transduction histidine kinase